MPRRGGTALYWDNHDQPRAVSRFGSDDPRFRELSAKLLASVLHMHRGTPYVYQGEELGMTNVPCRSIEDFLDIDSLNHYREAVAAGENPAQVLNALRRSSRDNGRTPMQWDAGPHAGFTTGRPWRPVNPNHREINAAVQVGDPNSVFSHYRRLIALRHELAVVALGDFRMLLPEHEQIYAFKRTLGDVELLVLANFSNEQATAELPEAALWRDAELLLSNYPKTPGLRGGSIVLEPWEARIHKRQPRVGKALPPPRDQSLVEEGRTQERA